MTWAFCLLESTTTMESSVGDRALIIIGWVATTLFAYWAGARQRNADRRADFYKDLVASPSLSEIDQFFQTYRQELRGLSKNPTATAGGKATPRVVSKLHLKFSEELRELSNSITGRVHTFDPDAVECILEVIDELDDQITAWFFSTKQREEDVAVNLLNDAKRHLVRHIFKAKLNILK